MESSLHILRAIAQKAWHKENISLTCKLLQAARGYGKNVVEAALGHWKRDELKRAMTEVEQDSIAAEFCKEVDRCIAEREDDKAQRKQKKQKSDGGRMFPPANWVAAVPVQLAPSPEPATDGLVTPSSSPQRLRRSAAHFSMSLRAFELCTCRRGCPKLPRCH